MRRACSPIADSLHPIISIYDRFAMATFICNGHGHQAIIPTLNLMIDRAVIAVVNIMLTYI